MEQEIEQERELDNMDNTSREINPYKELVVNNVEKIEPLMMQMEQWSILSNVLNYVQHSRLNSMNHTLDIKAVDKYKYRPSRDSRECKKLDFGASLHKLWEEYMDICEGIHSEVLSSNRFDKNSDISTTYLGRVNKEMQNTLKAEESFPISEHGYTLSRLLDGTECQMLLDTGASKSLCQNHSICDVNHSTPYRNLPQGCKEYRLEMGNVSVYYLIHQ